MNTHPRRRRQPARFALVLPFAAALAAPTFAQSNPFHAATWLAGSVFDDVHAVARSATGDVLVVGATRSHDLPTSPGAFQTSFQGIEDAFVARLSADLTQVLALTYLGGAERDQGHAVVVAADGTIWVAGSSEGQGFPTTSNAYSSVEDGRGNAFVVQVDASLSTVLYASYFGEVSSTNRGLQRAFGLAVDDAASLVYIAGETNRTMPSTAGSLPFTPNSNSLFLAAFDHTDPLQATIHYATQLPGSGLDRRLGGLDVDAQGVVTLSGITSSTDIPTTPGALQAARPGSQAGFLMQIDTAPGAMQPLLYATYLGGSGVEDAIRHAVDETGRIHVALETSSTDVPATPNAPIPVGDGTDDAYHAQIDPGQSGAASLVYGSYAFTQGSLALHGLHYAAGRVLTLWEVAGFGFPTTVGAFMRRQTGLLRGYVAEHDVSGASGSAPPLSYGSFYGGRGVQPRAAHYDGASVTIGGRAGSDGTGLPITLGVAQPTRLPGGGFVSRFDLAPWPDPTSRFGVGCQGSGGIVDLDVSSAPQLGFNFVLQASNLGSGTSGALFAQVVPLAGTPPAPIPLDGIGATGCSLLIAPQVTLFVPRQATPQPIQIPLGTDPALLSVRVFAQYADLDAGANPAGVTLSNGVNSEVRW